MKQQKQGIIQRHAKADNFKGFVQVLNTLLPIALLWWAAVWSAQQSYWAVAAVAVLLSLFTLRVLVLMHECGHGSLFRTAWLNRALGFLFGVITGMPQYVWSKHHDYHHCNNGNWEKYRGPLTTPTVDEYAAMTTAQQRMYRYTRSIGVAPLGGFVYLLFNPRFTWLKGSIEFLIHIIKMKIRQPEGSFRTHASGFKTRYWNSASEYWHMFWNNVVLLSAWVLVCSVIDVSLFFAVYVSSVSLAGGLGIMLFTVQHNFEHAYATDSTQWDYDTGAMEGTSFLLLPRWLNWFTANIAYHHIHHLSAKIPNYRLAQCHEENRELFAEVTRLKLSHVYGALKCLLWDEQAHRIISFAEYERRYQAANLSAARDE
jgi:omega-6 fatty acid desaturase (delta-12 desaturase)